MSTSGYRKQWSVWLLATHEVESTSYNSFIHSRILNKTQTQLEEGYKGIYDSVYKSTEVNAERFIWMTERAQHTATSTASKVA